MATVNEVIAAAAEVYEVLGPNHSEATYHRSMERELSERGIGFSSEGVIPISYKGQPVGHRRPDIFVDGEDGTIIVELKANSSSGEDQLLDYQRILEDDENFDVQRGLLIRFNDDVEVVKS